jgi:rhamnogalacturonan endolyase
MVVRDLDGDGKAELCLRTASYAATREQAFDGGKGFVLEGPEYLTVYAGDTGREIAKVDWIERGRPEDWADHTGNRSSRHMLGVAYLDGKTPSVLVVRGTYGLMKVDAWTLRAGTLQKIWRWTNERQPFKYQGQGQHSIKVGDIDGDGFDEILNGSIAIDNDGRTLWGTGMGHGDRFYLSISILPEPASRSGTPLKIPTRKMV